MLHYRAGMDLAAYRAEFSEHGRYLNFAGLGPMSSRALARLHEHGEIMMVSDRSPVEPFLEAWDEALRVGGELLGTDADHVTFPPSTSHGLFVAAFGLAGGNVVVPANEFPANRYPWIRAAELGRIELRLVEVPDGRVTADLLRPHIDHHTAAVAVSAVGYSTGFRADLAALAEVAGEALLVVDAVQTLGAWRVDMSDADVVVSGSQKWMRAGIGSAIAGFSDRALERLEPTLTGWLGVEDMFGPAPAPHDPLPHAGRYSAGSPPFLGVGALRGSIELTLEAGIGPIEAAVRERAQVFGEALTAAGAEILAGDLRAEERASIYTFRMPGRSTEEVAAALTGEGFVFAERDGLVRVSPHATTPLDSAADLRKTLESLG